MVENKSLEELFSLKKETNPDKIVRVKARTYNKSLSKTLPVGKGNKTLVNTSEVINASNS